MPLPHLPPCSARHPPPPPKHCICLPPAPSALSCPAPAPARSLQPRPGTPSLPPPLRAPPCRPAPGATWPQPAAPRQRAARRPWPDGGAEGMSTSRLRRRRRERRRVVGAWWGAGRQVGGGGRLQGAGMGIARAPFRGKRTWPEPPAPTYNTTQHSTAPAPGAAGQPDSCPSEQLTRRALQLDGVPHKAHGAEVVPLKAQQPSRQPSRQRRLLVARGRQRPCCVRRDGGGRRGRRRRRRGRGRGRGCCRFRSCLLAVRRRLCCWGCGVCCCWRRGWHLKSRRGRRGRGRGGCSLLRGGRCRRLRGRRSWRSGASHCAGRCGGFGGRGERRWKWATWRAVPTAAGWT